MAAAVAAIVTPLTTREVLSIRVVRRMWYALIISTFGDFLALFAVLGIVSFKMHAAAEQVTWVQIAALLPIVIMGPLAGVFVDRWPLKPTLVTSDVARAGLTMLLLFATHLWHFYLILALISIVSGFFGPAQQCTIRTSVPAEGMMATSAVMQQAIFLVRVIAPAIAGLLVASFGAVSCYLIDTVSFLGSALLIASTTIMRRAPMPNETSEDTARGVRKVWLDMRVGFDFIVHRRAILFVILALAAAVFTLGCFAPLIAIYVRECLHGTTRSFGIISSMIGVGILFGFFAVQHLAKKYANQELVFGGLMGMAGGLLVLASISQIACTIAAAFLIGFSVAGILLPAQTLIQQETPEELVGRVSSTGMSIVFGAQVVGLFLSGLLTRFLGVREVFLLSAIFLMGLVFVGHLSLRRQLSRRVATV
ncbi:MFS transporter [Granulicella arctica]|uniref:MFS transporter n=1 Tax=Granulicella arctica TaxID=940613 RepID=UPI0021E0A3E3|nr:MFS transporter [Granulicella arctica]